MNGGHRLTTEQKLALDTWYIEHQSAVVDLVVVARTLLTMVFGERVPEQLSRPIIGGNTERKRRALWRAWRSRRKRTARA